jgi:hypothetical protein
LPAVVSIFHKRTLFTSSKQVALCEVAKKIIIYRLVFVMIEVGLFTLEM